MVVAAIAAAPAHAGKIVDRVVGTQASGTTGGLFNGPLGVAVNYPAVADGNGTDGWVYVADDANHRIQAFDGTGVFQFAIGRNVIKASPAVDTDLGDAFEKCTHAPDCQAGSFGTTADGPTGEFDNPQGVAINQATGHLYVRDRDNRRVQEFTATGDFVRMWGQDVINGAVANSNGTGFEICDVTNGNVASDCKQGATTSTGNGGAFASSSTASAGIAAMPPGAANAGNVFVVDPGNRRLQEFTAAGAFVRLWGWDVVATGQVGDLGTSAFEICASIAAGVCKAGNTSAGTDNGRWGSNQPVYVTADPLSGTVYASDSNLNSRVMVFDTDAALPAGLLLPALDVPTLTGNTASQARDMTVNPSNGNLFAGRSQQSVGVAEIANAWTPTPTQVDSHYALDFDGVPIGLSTVGLALNPTSGDLYATTSTGSGGHRLFAADADGAPPASSSVDAVTGVGTTTATLSGTVNPEGGTLSASYRFQYSADGVTWTDVAAAVDVGNGTADVPVQASVTGLEPNTLYRARIATRKQFGNPHSFSPESTFVTDGAPPTVETLPVGPRSATTAQLRGSVDPNGTPTTYWFEYGGDQTYGTRIPLLPAPAGAGNEPLLLVQDVTGLLPSTTYHYRIVADGLGAPVDGADQTFTTRDPSASVPGVGRGVELVSPADKVGGIGVGSWYDGPATALYSGVAGQRGDRFAVSGAFGSMLTDGAQAYADDWAFAERVDALEGWRSNSPVTHPASGAQDYRYLMMQTATPDLARVSWRSNGGLLRVFPEQQGWDGALIGSTSYLGDWAGRWEIFGPVDPDAQVFAGTTRPHDLVLSADGSTAAAVTSVQRGLAGPGDPSLGLTAGQSIGSVYLADVAGPLADSLPATGQRVLANVCTSGTLLPSVDGGGDLIDAPCGAGSLTSPSGATLQRGGSASTIPWTTLRGLVSDNGSRLFFMSPDPQAPGVPTGSGSSFCSAPGPAQRCPAQLFVRQRDAEGEATVRWISRSRSVDLGGGRYGGQPIAGQDATLLGQALFEGASADGDKVFFRSNSALTPDDPNGGVQQVGGVKTGSASALSWDLFMYDFPDDPQADPGDGTLTRLSAGPTGSSDPGNPQGSNFDQGALRFVSDDGTRLYFTTAAPLAGVGPAQDGTVTAPGGTSGGIATSNLYLYDASASGAERWRFVARLPRGAGGNDCATVGVADVGVLTPASSASTQVVGFNQFPPNCVRGTRDGGFVTFFSRGRLTIDDPDETSGDMYAYDASRDELVRLSAPQGGVGGSHACGTGGIAATTPCNADPGFGSYPDTGNRAANPPLGVATEPSVAGDRVAFFQSRSRLVPEDTDSAYDVYQWRNGELSLLTPGDSLSDHGQMYKGNDVTGRNVYFATMDKMSWQDFDSVLDVYTARTGGGIQEPAPPDLCVVLAGGCHGGGVPPLPVQPKTTSSAGSPQGDNASPGVRKTLRVGTLSRTARRRAARRGVLPVPVRTSRPGLVRVLARAKIGKRTRRVAGRKVRVREAGAVTVKLRLNRAAKRRLQRGRALRVTLRVASSGARTRTATVRLKRGRRS
jgi:hypothetical protein